MEQDFMKWAKEQDEKRTNEIKRIPAIKISLDFEKMFHKNRAMEIETGMTAKNATLETELKAIGQYIDAGIEFESSRGFNEVSDNAQSINGRLVITKDVKDIEQTLAWFGKRNKMIIKALSLAEKFFDAEIIFGVELGERIER